MQDSGEKDRWLSENVVWPPIPAPYTRCRKFCLASTLVAALFSGACKGHPLTDEQMIALFQRNMDLFDQVAQESSLQPICPYANNPYSCVPSGSQQIENRLKRRLSLSIQRIYIDRKLNDSLWIPIETYGALSLSSATRGYVYCKCSLTPLTQNTIDALAQGANGVWYKPIGNGWMLFASR